MSTRAAEKENEKRAENYISDMIRTMMSISAILVTISVAVLAITAKQPLNQIQVLIVLFVVISVFIFLLSFWQGMKSLGTLVLAIKEGKGGYEKARRPLWRYLKILMIGLILLGVACLMFFIDLLLPSPNGPTRMGGIETSSLLSKIIISIGYLFIALGSVGMICFAVKFPLSGRIKDLRFTAERVLHLDGYSVWKWSWILIILGTLIQLFAAWIIQ